MFNQVIATTHATTYETLSTKPLSVSELSGNYTITAFGPRRNLLPSILTIDGTGNISADLNYFEAVNFSCKFTGVVAPDPSIRFAEVRIDIPKFGCPWDLSGRGKLVLESYGGTSRIRIGTQSDGNLTGATIYAEKR
jgi:hypothetical protein